MKRVVLLGDSPFLGEVENKVQYALERCYSMGINRIITKFRTDAHVFVDPFLLKLTNNYPELFTLSLKKYGDLVMKNNKELVLLAIKNNPVALEYVSEELKNDKEFMKIIAKESVSALQFASNKLRNDKDIAKRVEELWND